VPPEDWFQHKISKKIEKNKNMENKLDKEAMDKQVDAHGGTKGKR